MNYELINWRKNDRNMNSKTYLFEYNILNVSCRFYIARIGSN